MRETEMNKTRPTEDPVREHVFDGIQEYDKSLPNWWLFTLYATIAFSIGYWIYFHKTDLGSTPKEALKQALAAVESAQPGDGAVSLDDDALWEMSLNPEAVASGKATYATLCVACHGPELQGAIGVSLVDAEWKHGSDPLSIRGTILSGILDKGMPAWGPILGEKKVNEVTAFVLSYHAKPSS